MIQPKWSETEVAALAMHRQLSDEELADLIPGRSVSAIKNQRATQDLPKSGQHRRSWTESDYEFMRANRHMKDAEMARALGVRLGPLSNARKSADIRKVYRCAKCDVILGSQGKWCGEHNIAARRWSQYANKAKARGLGFDLTHADLHDLLEKPCAYCAGPGGGIDRIDSDKGYQTGNVASCCWRCNAMKNDLPLSVWIEHMKKIIKHTERQQ